MPATAPIRSAHQTYRPHQTVQDVTRELDNLIGGGSIAFLPDGSTLTPGEVWKVGTGGFWETLTPPATPGHLYRNTASDLAYSTFTIPDTFTTGDLPIASATNTLTALGIGATDRFLTVAGGLPAWSAWSLPTAIGANGEILHVTAGAADWTTTFTGAYTFTVAGTAITISSATPLLLVQVALGGGGDSAVQFSLEGGQNWVAGIDNSDSGAFVLSASATLGTSNALRLGTDLAGTAYGAWTFSAAGTALTVTNNALISGNLTVSGYYLGGTATDSATAGDWVSGLLNASRAFFDQSSGTFYIRSNATPLTAANHDIVIDTALPALLLYENDQGADAKGWDLIALTGVLQLRTINDALGTGVSIWEVSRSGGTPTGFVVNQSGADMDTRIEGDTNAVLGVFDAGLDQFSTTYGGTRASAAGATWNAVYWKAGTATITGSTNITTATGFNAFTIEAPTLSAASALTVTNAATVYIAGPPVGGGAGPATITNPYSLWVDAGNVRIDVGLIVGGTALTTGFIADITGDLRVSSGLNVGGTTTVGDGVAIITASLAVGQTTAATNALDVTGKIKTTSHIEIDGDLDHDGSTVGFYGVTPVARPAAYTITNDTSDRTLDADTLTLSDVADVLATVMRDLASQGLLQVS